MWLKSAEFAEKFGVNIRKIQRIVNKKASEKILRIDTQFFAYANTHGKGGKSGRVLMIWDKPFESEGEAARFVAEDGTRKFSGWGFFRNYVANAQECACKSYKIVA